MTAGFPNTPGATHPRLAVVARGSLFTKRSLLLCWRRGAENCWSASVRAGCGPPVCAPRVPDRANGSFWCWPRFHPQTPAGSRAPLPTAPAIEPFFRPRPAGFVRRRTEFFLYLQPSCRSHKSIVEVLKGRSMRAPNSASVASGCSDSSLCRRSLRSAVSSVRRPHKWVWGWSVPRCRNCWRTRRTAATQKPQNSAISRVLLLRS